MLCLTCGQSTPEKSAYCMVCGTATAARKIASISFKTLEECKSCGLKSFGASYCSSCGAMLTVYKPAAAAGEMKVVDAKLLERTSTATGNPVKTVPSQFPEPSPSESASESSAKPAFEPFKFPEQSPAESPTVSGAKPAFEPFQLPEPSSAQTPAASGAKPAFEPFQFPEQSPEQSPPESGVKPAFESFQFRESSLPHHPPENYAKQDSEWSLHPDSFNAQSMPERQPKPEVREMVSYPIFTASLLVIAIILVIITFFGDFQSNNDRDTGFWQDGIYYNSFFGLSFHPPSDWEDALDFMQAIARSELPDELGDAGEMIMASMNYFTGSNVILGIETVSRVNARRSEEDLIAIMRSNLERMGMSFSGSETEQVGDQVWYTLDIRLSDGQQRMYMKKDGNTVLSITVSIAPGCRSTIAQVISSFSPFN